MRLILGEEAFLTGQLGEPYREYLRAVPRLIPRLRDRACRSLRHSRIGCIALLTEINPIGVFFTLAFCRGRYDNLLMLKASWSALVCRWSCARASCLARAKRSQHPRSQPDHGSAPAPGAAKVRPSEAVGIFEPEAQQPVDADVVDPDERERQQAVRMQQQREQRQQRRQQRRCGRRCKCARPSTAA